MVHYLTPFDTSKRIGYAHNEAVKTVTDPEAWICLRDADTMFLTPDFGNIVERAIIDHGANYQLFGCLTNRLGVKHQLLNGTISDNADISHHITMAESIKSNDEVRDCNLVAGMFMLFHRKTWDLVGGFDESIQFDILFSEKVIKAGGRLGIIQSLYLLHLYRWGKPNPQMCYEHLI